MTDGHASAISYGVDFGGGRAVVVRASRRGRAVETLFEGAPAAADPAWVRAVGSMRADALAGRGFAAVAMPAAESLACVLEAPFPSLRKAHRVLPSLLDVQLPFPLEGCAVEYVDLRRVPGRRVRALAVAARGEALEARLAACREAGLDPAVVDHEALALWEWAAGEPGWTAEARVVAYVAPDRLVLAAGRGGDYAGSAACRPPPGDAGAATAELAARARRFVQSLPELARAGALDWLWVGPGADGVPDLEAALDLPVRPSYRRHPVAPTALARALAARQFPGGRCACNLAGGARLHPALARRARRRANGRTAVALAACAAIVAVDVAWVARLRADAAAAQAGVARLAREIAGGARLPRGFEVARARERAAARAAEGEPFLAAFAPSLSLPLAEVLRRAAEDGLYLDTIEWGGPAVTLRGSGRDWNASDRLAAALDRRGYRVRVERGEADAEERVPFVLKGERP